MTINKSQIAELARDKREYSLLMTLAAAAGDARYDADFGDVCAKVLEEFRELPEVWG